MSSNTIQLPDETISDRVLSFAKSVWQLKDRMHGRNENRSGVTPKFGQPVGDAVELIDRGFSDWLPAIQTIGVLAATDRASEHLRETLFLPTALDLGIQPS